MKTFVIYVSATCVGILGSFSRAQVPSEAAAKTQPAKKAGEFTIKDRRGQALPSLGVVVTHGDTKVDYTTTAAGLLAIPNLESATSIQIRLEGLSLTWESPFGGTEIRLPIDHAFAKAAPAESDTASMLGRGSGEKVVLVTSYDGSPVAGATVVVDYDSVLHPPEFKTDEHGRAEVKVGAFHSIVVKSAGFQLRLYSWQGGTYQWPLHLEVPPAKR